MAEAAKTEAPSCTFYCASCGRGESGGWQVGAQGFYPAPNWLISFDRDGVATAVCSEPCAKKLWPDVPISKPDADEFSLTLKKLILNVLGPLEQKIPIDVKGKN